MNKKLKTSSENNNMSLILAFNFSINIREISDSKKKQSQIFAREIHARIKLGECNFEKARKEAEIKFMKMAMEKISLMAIGEKKIPNNDMEDFLNNVLKDSFLKCNLLWIIDPVTFKHYKRENLPAITPKKSCGDRFVEPLITVMLLATFAWIQSHF